MSKDTVQLLTRLSPTQRQVLDLACRGESNRQISQRLSLTVSHVNQCMSACLKKLEIQGDGHRAVVHWYWTQGPGLTEQRMATLQWALGAMAGAFEDIVKEHRKLLSQRDKV